MIGKELREEWMKLPAECFETLTFGDLKQWEMFIAFPLPGDNNGHGGFKDGGHIFKKLKTPVNSDSNYWVNVVCLFDGAPSYFPDKMLVLKVG